MSLHISLSDFIAHSQRKVISSSDRPGRILNIDLLEIPVEGKLIFSGSWNRELQSSYFLTYHSQCKENYDC